VSDRSGKKSRAAFMLGVTAPFENDAGQRINCGMKLRVDAALRSWSLRPLTGVPFACGRAFRAETAVGVRRTRFHGPSGDGRGIAFCCDRRSGKGGRWSGVVNVLMC